MSEQRLIDANKLKKATEKYTDCANIDCINCFRELIDDAPTIETYTEEDIRLSNRTGFDDGYEKAKEEFERPKGHWVEKQETSRSVSFYCSECECAGLGVENFCSWCGADMRKENDNGTITSKKE